MRFPQAHCCPGTTSKSPELSVSKLSESVHTVCDYPKHTAVLAQPLKKPRLSFSKWLESVPTLCDASEHTAVLAQPQTNPENVHTLCDSPEDTLARRPTTPNIFVSNWSENEHTLCDSPKHTAVLAQHPKQNAELSLCKCTYLVRLPQAHCCHGTYSNNSKKSSKRRMSSKDSQKETQ